MRTTYITATIIALVLVGWLASGALNDTRHGKATSIAELSREQARVQEDTVPTSVRVSVLEASYQNRIVTVRGQTENKRTVDVKVEIPGIVVNRPVERGMQVAKNDLLCEISIEDRQVALTESHAALAQARIEYQGALKLQQKGFNSEATIAASKARLAAAQANVNRRELTLTKVHVRAPFSGVVEEVHQEVGDYVTPGANCATVVDMDPMLLVGRVSEQDVVDLQIDQEAIGYLRDGAIVSGPVTFIGQVNDPATRTYAVEIQLDNANGALRSGITTEIRVPVERILAQKVSPALLALDDAGLIGIRTINDDYAVEFHLVNILKDAPDGVWVTGLPQRVGVITVGQELVTAGEIVNPIFQGADTLNATNTTEPKTLKTGVKDTSASLSDLDVIAI